MRILLDAREHAEAENRSSPTSVKKYLRITVSKISKNDIPPI